MAKGKVNDNKVNEESPTGLVKMTRQGGEPTTADVHPDEVDNYKAGGWKVAEE